MALATAVGSIVECRAAVHAAAVAALAELGELWPAGGTLPAWRIHIRPPDTLTPPVVWIDVPEILPAGIPGTRLADVTFPVWVAVDGADAAQVDALDVWAWALWCELAGQGWRPLSSTPQPVDAGGPTVRGLELRFLASVPQPCL